MKSPNQEIWWRRWKTRLDEIIFGAAMSWLAAPHIIQKHLELERIFALKIGAILLGLPVLPSVYSLRLLPYLMPNLLYWKRMTIFDRELEGADLKHIGY